MKRKSKWFLFPSISRNILVQFVDAGKEASPTQGAIFFKETLLGSCQTQRSVHVQVTCMVDSGAMQATVLQLL
jgi:hypothetical protein